MLASLLIGSFEPHVPLAVVGGLLLVTALLANGIKCPTRTGLAKTNPIGDLREGLVELTSNKWILTVVAASFLLMVSLSGFQSVVGPIVAVSRPLVGESVWGLGIGLMGAGMLLSGLLMFRCRPSRPLVLGLAASASCTLPPLMLWLHASSFALYAAFLCAGIGLEVFNICWISALQSSIAPDRLGRVSTLDTFGSYLGAPIGTTIAGTAYSLVGEALLPVIILTLLGAALIPLLSREVRRVSGVTRVAEIPVH